MTPPAFALHGVRLERAGVRVLDDVSLDIPDGQVTALIGPSGAGKSSLLRLLNRLDDPDAGEIRCRGRPVVDMPVRELRRQAGFVFQTPVMFPGTVRENLEVAANIGDLPAAEVSNRVVESMGLAELDTALADRAADRLSVGEKQRANIARALMTGPEILLMDEPTASLDPETAERLGRTIRHLSTACGVTIVLATHRLKEAKAVCTFVVMLDGGHVVEAGPASALFEESAHPRLRAFLERVG